MARSADTEKVCPRCGHIRKPDESAPDWQCPACGIAYHKYRALMERAKSSLAPPGGAGPAPLPDADGSIWALGISNAVALWVAVVQGWSLFDLMLVYWIQSVAIGSSNVFRILALEKFSTENFTMNDRAVDPTPETRRQVAIFFLVHYGFFHLAYLVFIVTESPGGMVFDVWFLVCALVFAINHFYSYRYNRDLDRRGTPNIGTLMFTPYLRIVPMHLTIVLGSTQLVSSMGLLFFGGLKTLVDIVMHSVEHARLKRRKASVSLGGQRE